MAKFEKPTRPSRLLEAPPKEDETRGNLEAPELAPFPPGKSQMHGFDVGMDAPKELRKIDGRSRRKTGRTEAFATRVSPDFKERLDRVAEKTGMPYCEILEIALRNYEMNLGSS